MQSTEYCKKHSGREHCPPYGGWFSVLSGATLTAATAWLEAITSQPPAWRTNAVDSDNNDN